MDPDIVKNGLREAAREAEELLNALDPLLDDMQGLIKTFNDIVRQLVNLREFIATSSLLLRHSSSHSETP